MFKRALTLAGSCLLVLLAARWFVDLWGPALHSPFLREDSWLYGTSPPSLVDFLQSFFSPPDRQWYLRPIRHWAIAVCTWVFGIRPEPLHGLSWLLLAGALGFFYASLRRFYTEAWLLLACLGAYALSPVHGKSFYWISALHNHLVLFFASGALYFRIAGHRRSSLLFFLLALFSRESAFGWLLPLLAVDRLLRPERGWKGSFDLLALSALSLGAFFASGVMGGSAFERQALFDPLASLEALAAYVAVFSGWELADTAFYWQVRYTKAQWVGIVCFFAYGAWLLVRARKEPRARLVLALCAGGVAVLLSHPRSWQVEYPVLFGLGLAALLGDFAHRLLSRLPRIPFVPELGAGVLSLLILLAGYRAGAHTAETLEKSFGEEAAYTERVTRAFFALAESLPLGSVILVERFDPWIASTGREVELGTFLPRAIHRAHLGRYVVFGEGKGVGQQFTAGGLMARQVLEEVKPYRVKLEGELWTRLPP